MKILQFTNPDQPDQLIPEPPTTACGKASCPLQARCMREIHKLEARQTSWNRVLQAKQAYLDNRDLQNELETIVAHVHATTHRLHQVHDILDRNHADKYLFHVEPTKVPRAEHTPASIPTPKDSIAALAAKMKQLKPEQLLRILENLKQKGELKI